MCSVCLLGYFDICVGHKRISSLLAPSWPLFPRLSPPSPLFILLREPFDLLSFAVSPIISLTMIPAILPLLSLYLTPSLFCRTHPSPSISYPWSSLCILVTHSYPFPPRIAPPWPFHPSPHSYLSSPQFPFTILTILPPSSLASLHEPPWTLHLPPPLIRGPLSSPLNSIYHPHYTFHFFFFSLILSFFLFLLFLLFVSTAVWTANLWFRSRY